MKEEKVMQPKSYDILHKDNLDSKLNIDKVLLVCDKDNIGSAKSIKNNGAILENEIVKDGKTIQRYWIEIE